MASVICGKCYLWQNKCIMENVIMAKVYMANETEPLYIAIVTKVNCYYRLSRDRDNTESLVLEGCRVKDGGGQMVKGVSGT